MDVFPVPIFNEGPQASQILQDMFRSCKEIKHLCSRNCVCKEQNLKCTEICSCHGNEHCHNEYTHSQVSDEDD